MGAWLHPKSPFRPQEISTTQLTTHHTESARRRTQWIEAGPTDGPLLIFTHRWDTICDTVHSRLTDPMRAGCADPCGVTIEGGHELQLERPAEVSAAIETWLDAKNLC